MSFLRRWEPSQPAAHYDTARLAAARRRVAGMTTDALLEWADTNVSNLGRCITDVMRKGDMDALDNAIETAEFLYAMFTELDQRRID